MPVLSPRSTRCHKPATTVRCYDHARGIRNKAERNRLKNVSNSPGYGEEFFVSPTHRMAPVLLQGETIIESSDQTLMHVVSQSPRSGEPSERQNDLISVIDDSTEHAVVSG